MFKNIFFLIAIMSGLLQGMNNPTSSITIPPLNPATKNLFNAIEQGNKKDVLLALKNGADVNAYNEHGRIPLGWLITTTKDKNKTTALQIAEILLAQRDININKADGILGVKNGQAIIFKIISDSNHFTAQLLKLLLQNSLLDFTVNDGINKFNPLAYAAARLKIYKENETDSAKHTILTDMLKDMLRHKNARDVIDAKTGNSTLHIAVSENMPDIVTFLLESGIDVSHKNNMDQTAYALAVELDNQDIKQLFNDYRMRQNILSTGKKGDVRFVYA